MSERSWREQAMELFANARDLTDEEQDAYRRMRMRLSVPSAGVSSQQDDERERLAALLDDQARNGVSVPGLKRSDLRRAASLLRSSGQPSTLDVNAGFADSLRPLFEAEGVEPALAKRLAIIAGARELAHRVGGAPQDVEK